MAALAVPAVPLAPYRAYRPIIEDSLFSKALCAIPFVGIPVYFTAMHSINKQLSEKLQPPPPRLFPEPDLNAPRVIELIALKNQYYAIEMLNETLTVAILIAQVAVGTFTGLAAFVTLMIVGRCLQTVVSLPSRISYNKALIQEIQRSGIQPNMEAL